MSYRRFFDLRTRAESYEILEKLHEVFAIHGSLTEACLSSFRDSIPYITKFDGPSLYADPKGYFCYRAIEGMIKKNTDLPGSSDLTRRQRAIEKFIETERKCSETNRRLAPLAFGYQTESGSMLYRIQRKIAGILGEAPNLEDLHLRFGPGSNVNVRRKTSARHKLNAPISCSCETIDLFNEFKLKGLYPAWLSGKPEVMSGELTTVPKTAEIDRCIMIEPIFNTAIQLPIGSFMKRRLLESGCNLYDQGRNRNLARRGSCDGSTVTIDFSSASDLIACVVVSLLLPLQWVELLSQCRTSWITCKEANGRLRQLEKFSSMGNGFTFELESLIFYAVGLAVYEEAGIDPTNLSVYGDDVIIDRKLYPRFLSVVEWLGFEINKEKSCLSGPFRESCGGDYLNGINVRPFYVKGRFTSARIVAMINHYLDSPFPELGYDVLLALLPYLPKKHRLFGPRGFGSGHIHVPHSKQVVRHGRSKGLCGFSFSTYVQCPLRDESALPRGDALYPFYSQYMKEQENPTSYQYNPFVHRLGVGRRAFQLFARDLDDIQNNTGKSIDDPYVLRGSHGERRIKIYSFSVDTDRVYVSALQKARRRNRRRKEYLERCNSKVTMS